MHACMHARTHARTHARMHTCHTTVDADVSRTHSFLVVYGVCLRDSGVAACNYLEGGIGLRLSLYCLRAPEIEMGFG